MKRTLACNLDALSPEQRAHHMDVTRRLIETADRRELDDAIEYTFDRERFPVADLVGWAADETRCCPAVDFHLDLPFDGPLTLRLGGGPDVKAFLTSLGL